MGGLYVLLMLGLVSGLSYFMTGGVVPGIERDPENPQIVEIDDQLDTEARQNLQLVNIGIKPTETPTPSPIPTVPDPTVTPTPEPTVVEDVVEECLNNTVLSLILDVSTSMVFDNKLGQLNSAMNSFSNDFRPEMVVGAVHFAGPTSFPATSTNAAGSRTLLPYTRFSDNSQLVKTRLTTLKNQVSEFTPDGTYMANAFRRTINNINSLKSSNNYPGYRYATVLFTDGVPEGDGGQGCVVSYPSFSDSRYTYSPLCFSRAQDPRTSGLTTQLKNVSDQVYAVGLYTGPRERRALSEARSLLAATASEPSFAADTSNPAELGAIFDNVLNQVCEEV